MRNEDKGPKFCDSGMNLRFSAFYSALAVKQGYIWIRFSIFCLRCYLIGVLSRFDYWISPPTLVTIYLVFEIFGLCHLNSKCAKKIRADFKNKMLQFRKKMFHLKYDSSLKGEIFSKRIRGDKLFLYWFNHDQCSILH